MQMLDEYSAQAVARAVEEFSKTHGKVGMVCIDTVARNFGPGDENNTKDMTKFVANLDAYIGTGINKLLVHHTGHTNTERARGSSVLLGAVDSEYRLSKYNGLVTLTNTKMKDDPEFRPMVFKPDLVELSGNFGNKESSVVLVPTDEKPIVKLTVQMRDALALLDTLCQEDGHCYKADWMFFCDLDKVYARSSFYSAINTMAEKKVIRITGDCVQRY
jgi:enamine deaminase RidA (YjgF/YER057c/UK114 family)